MLIRKRDKCCVDLITKLGFAGLANFHIVYVAKKESISEKITIGDVCIGNDSILFRSEVSGGKSYGSSFKPRA